MLLEGVGRIGVFSVPLFLSLSVSTPADDLALCVAVAALAFYYLVWARYFLQGRTAALLYRQIAGIPVPLAVSPVVFLLACSVLTRSLLLAFVTVAFGSAHIFLSVLRSRAT